MDGLLLTHISNWIVNDSSNITNVKEGQKGQEKRGEIKSKNQNSRKTRDNNRGKKWKLFVEHIKI